MNRKRNRGVQQKRSGYDENVIERALKSIRNREITASNASRLYGIPVSTLYHRLRRLSAMSEVQASASIKNESLPEDVDLNRAKMNAKPACSFCGLGGERELELGKFYVTPQVNAHYFCLLFSSGLPQNGEDEEGILGFIISDILKEVRRGNKLSCTYCAKRGATVGCNEKKCRRTYHYGCGLKSHALCKFTDDFRSYCVSHREIQNGIGVGEMSECPICMEELIVDPRSAIWAPCCQRKSWFHKLCMQKLAVNAGYFFKCPLCNDKDVFVLEMQNFGIFVPETDASWELEPNAFSDLERRIHCDAPKCRCPDGRKCDDEGTRWEILLCNLCGSAGIHVTCGGLPFNCTEWNCPTCSDMLAESERRMLHESRNRRLMERRDRIEQQNQLPKVSSDDESENCDVSEKEVIPESSRQTSLKRKCVEENMEGESPQKICHVDKNSVTRISRTSDSEEEIDIESDEFPIPPHVVIRDIEEKGKELNKHLLELKEKAFWVQEKMIELRLTDVDIITTAKESSICKELPLEKSDVINFCRYNLPYERMVKVHDIILNVFKLHEERIAKIHPSVGELMSHTHKNEMSEYRENYVGELQQNHAAQTEELHLEGGNRKFTSLTIASAKLITRYPPKNNSNPGTSAGHDVSLYQYFQHKHGRLDSSPATSLCLKLSPVCDSGSSLNGSPAPVNCSGISSESNTPNKKGLSACRKLPLETIAVGEHETPVEDNLPPEVSSDSDRNRWLDSSKDSIKAAMSEQPTMECSKANKDLSNEDYDNLTNTVYGHFSHDHDYCIGEGIDYLHWTQTVFQAKKICDEPTTDISDICNVTEMISHMQLDQNIGRHEDNFSHEKLNMKMKGESKLLESTNTELVPLGDESDIQVSVTDVNACGRKESGCERDVVNPNVKASGKFHVEDSNISFEKHQYASGYRSENSNSTKPHYEFPLLLQGVNSARTCDVTDKKCGFSDSDDDCSDWSSNRSLKNKSFDKKKVMKNEDHPETSAKFLKTTKSFDRQSFRPCYWGTYASPTMKIYRKKKEKVQLVEQQSNSSVQNGSSEAKCKPCVVVVERLPLPDKAVKVTVPYKQAIKIYNGRNVSYFAVKPPSFLREMYLSLHKSRKSLDSRKK